MDTLQPMSQNGSPPEKATAGDAHNRLLSKQQAITSACERRDLPQLAKLADSEGGLLEDHFRQSACESCRRGLTPILQSLGPILLGYKEREESDEFRSLNTWKKLPPHPDEEQVQKDVDRAFVYYPRGKQALRRVRIWLI